MAQEVRGAHREAGFGREEQLARVPVPSDERALLLLILPVRTEPTKKGLRDRQRAPSSVGLRVGAHDNLRVDLLHLASHLDSAGVPIHILPAQPETLPATEAQH